MKNFAEQRKKNWKQNPFWRSHSLGAWDAEWDSYKEAAEAAGKSVNGWIRSWLNEAVKYERLLARERGLEAPGVSGLERGHEDGGV